MALDAEIAARVAAAGCPHCGGALHRANYERKPRGAAFGAAGEAFELRALVLLWPGGVPEAGDAGHARGASAQAGP